MVGKSSFFSTLGASAIVALGAAAVSIYIDQFSDKPCTVAGDCAEISLIMKGKFETKPMAAPTPASPIAASSCVRKENK